MATKTNDKILPSEYYAKAKIDRKPYEDRAEVMAKLSIPALMRDKSWTGTSSTPDSYGQAFGARCVNNFVSKIGMTLFPPNASAFRFTPNTDILKKVVVGGEGNEEYQKTITSSQNKVNDRLEASNTRNTIFTVLDHLTVVSSCILEKVPKRGYKVHTLRNFVVSLDDEGLEYKLCVYEKLEKIPDGIDYSGEEKDEYELYTMIEEIEPDKWVMTQEIDGEIIGKEKTFTDVNRPFSYQGWLWTQGDKYHRPYMDAYLGGFQEYSTWTKVLTKGGMISSKNITFVDERTGRTRLRDVKNAENGAIVQGRGDDVTSFQHGKNYDYQVALQAKAEIKEDLSMAFLLNVRRDAERVTAEEIRAMSAELENALASMYAVVSNKLIKRMVNWAMQDLGLKLKTIQVDVVTGLDALGRAVEAQKLDELMTRAGQLGFADRFKPNTLAIKYAGFYNVPTDDILMSEDEYNQMKQKQAEQQMVQQGGEALAQSAGQTAGQGEQV